jgi:hypothetical protein
MKDRKKRGREGGRKEGRNGVQNVLLTFIPRRLKKELIENGFAFSQW